MKNTNDGPLKRLCSTLIDYENTKFGKPLTLLSSLWKDKRWTHGKTLLGCIGDGRTSAGP